MRVSANCIRRCNESILIFSLFVVVAFVIVADFMDALFVVVVINYNDKDNFFSLSSSRTLLDNANAAVDNLLTYK